MDRHDVWLLRIALAVLLVGSVLAQVLIPVFASETGKTYAEVAHLVVPYAVVGILVVACGQVALIAIWRLSSPINGRIIFTRPALRWIDVITVSGALAVVLTASVMVHLLFIVRLGGPAVFFTLVACLALGPAFVLLMRVMRGQLESAISRSGHP
jgi:hypothetical protein